MECSQKKKQLQKLKETSTTSGPEGSVSNMCMKSLELLKECLESLKSNIKHLLYLPGCKINLNMESLLTLDVENQHAVTHFKADTFTLYEYAIIFGSSIEEVVKRVTTKWAAAYYTHPNSYYKLPTSHAVSLLSMKIAKPTLQTVTRNEEAEMCHWAKMHGKCVRQRTVRQDNTKDGAGTLPLNLYETDTILNPVDLNTLVCVEEEHVENEIKEPATPPDINDNIGEELSQSSPASADEYEDRFSLASESSVSSDDETG